MKKTALSITTLCAVALFYVSCSSNDDNTPVNQTDISSVAASVAIDAATELDINTGLFLANNTSITGKSTETPAGICATLNISTPTSDPFPKII